MHKFMGFIEFIWKNYVLLYFDHVIGTLIFVCECCVWIWGGDVSLIFFFKPLYLKFFLIIRLKVMVKRLYNPKNIWHRDTEKWTLHISPHSVCLYVCVHAPIDVHVVGGVVVCVALSSGGTYRLCQGNSVGAIAAVMHRIVSFFFLFLKRYFFTGSVSAYGLTPSCCCFHHYCWFLLLLFCSSGCTWPP